RSGRTGGWPPARTPRGGHRHIVQDLSRELDPRLPSSIDTIIHCAAVVGDDSPDASQIEAVNVGGTQRILDYGARAGAREFVFISTGGVYVPTRSPLAEDSPVGCPGRYVRSKQDAEALCRARTDARVTILRPFFPYGRGQRHRLVPKLQDVILAGKPVVLAGGGDGPRLNPVWSGDLVEAVVRTLGRSGGGHEVYNVAGPDVISLRQ